MDAITNAPPMPHNNQEDYFVKSLLFDFFENDEELERECERDLLSPLPFCAYTYVTVNKNIRIINNPKAKSFLIE